MKFISLFVVFAFLLPGICDAQNWQQINDFPGTERDDGTSFVIGNKAYCGTGNLPWGIGTIDFYEFDMTTDTWSAIASLPAGAERQYACGFADDSYGYVFGGYNAGNFFNDLWQYDPVANSWTEKTALPSTGRSASVHFVIGDTAYIVCGKTAADYAIDEVWAYNLLNDTWVQKNDFPFGNRWRACGASSATHGYLALGKATSTTYPEGLYEYDPQTDTWSILADFPMPGRSHSKMIFFDSDLLLLTGWDSLGNSHSDMWRYDIGTGVWDQLVSIPSTGRRAGMCFSNNIYLYYSAGINQTHARLKETWKNINPTGLEPWIIHRAVVFPNPTDGLVKIRLVNHPVQQIKAATIYTINGQEIWRMTFDNGVNQVQLDLSTFTPGVYTVQIEMADKTETQQIVVF